MARSHDKILRDMEQRPAEAVRLGGSFFAQSGEPTVQAFGGKIVEGMLNAADKLRGQHEAAFTTAHQAAGYASKLQEGRDPLLHRAFESMGGTIHNYGIDDPVKAKAMRDAALASARAHGPRFEDSIRLGAESERSGATARRASATPIPPPAPPEPPQGDGPGTMRKSKLSDVGAKPMGAAKPSGWGSTLAKGVVATLAVFGAVHLAEYTSIRVFGTTHRRSWAISATPWSKPATIKICDR